jgi:uncharacterized membrane protein YeaQ/YmgE (transglycosylase-associated protein family)
MMNIIWILVVGLVVGLLARFFYPGPVPMGWIASIVLGVGGSFLAGFLGSLLHGKPLGELHPAGFIYSILGAMVLIFLARTVFHLV